MYCLKCKSKTETINPIIQERMMKGNCRNCGAKKCQFARWSGIVNKTINNLPFEFYLPFHNFTGPETKLRSRLNEDDTPKSWSIPTNTVDKAAYHHDVCYRDNRDTKTRNTLCDKNMLEDLADIEDPTLRLERDLIEQSLLQ